MAASSDALKPSGSVATYTRILFDDQAIWLDLVNVAYLVSDIRSIGNRTTSAFNLVPTSAFSYPGPGSGKQRRNPIAFPFVSGLSKCYKGLRRNVNQRDQRRDTERILVQTRAPSRWEMVYLGENWHRSSL